MTQTLCSCSFICVSQIPPVYLESSLVFSRRPLDQLFINTPADRHDSEADANLSTIAVASSSVQV